MRILFLCTSLEPARDGVGDYTRSLARECARQGHPCGIIALHDRHITEPMESADDVGTEKIPFLRLPTKLTWSQRTKLASTFRSRFQPDWISLQFVAYGFDNRGITLNLNRVFQALILDHPLHLMLHELWIADASPAPLRHRLIGLLQRMGIIRMIAHLKPRVVTTSNPVYRTMLKERGIQAVTLPLFGNIPISPMDPPSKWPAELTEAGLNPDQSERHQWWLGIFFGALHPEWKPEPLISILLRAAHHANKRVCLLLAGHPGTGEAVWNNLKYSYPPEVVFVKSGLQSAEKISTLLQTADFGISASPWQLIGKSGTVAAMLDHGLPVIVTRDDFQPRLVPDEPPSRDSLIHRCDDALESKLRAGLSKRPPHSRLSDIAGQLCHYLQEATEKTSPPLSHP